VRIVVAGAGFRNKGAEAMARTVQAELGRRLPEAEFCLWRCAPGETRQALDAGFTPLPLPIDLRSLPIRSLQKVHLATPLWSAVELRSGDWRRLAQTPSREALLAATATHYLERVGPPINAVVDISGYAYGDEWTVERIQRNMPLMEYCERHRVPVIYLPQAWGPFRKGDVRAATRALVDVPYVTLYSRDAESSAHLEDLLGAPAGSVPSWPDIVFAFRGGSAEQGRELLRLMGCALERPIVGVAPNQQVYRRTPGTGAGNAYLQALVTLVHHCLDTHDVDVVLQANEIDPGDRSLDDRHLCAIVAAAVARSDRCFFSEQALTAPQTAALVGRFDYLVGSRFHSLVFALSQGVPCMTISWSHKYRELLRTFGLADDVEEFGGLDGEVLMTSFERGWATREQARPSIRETADGLADQVGRLFDDVANIITGGSRPSHD